MILAFSILVNEKASFIADGLHTSGLVHSCSGSGRSALKMSIIAQIEFPE